MCRRDEVGRARAEAASERPETQARTKAEREAGNDPRLSLEERDGSHAGFVDAVRKAADKVKASGFLLEKDAAALVKAAEASNVLK